MNDDTYEISTDPARLDATRVHHWLSTDAYWALGRTREKQDSAIANSLNFGLYDTASGEQLAYARVVTDHTTFAWLCDVYVDPATRGKGLGIALVTAVRDHLAPAGPAPHPPRHRGRPRRLRQTGLRTPHRPGQVDGPRPAVTGAAWRRCQSSKAASTTTRETTFSSPSGS
ncbi:GNAT superfamily N-acetyltransferase [Streptomyces sp. SPB162]|nr:GNAT superfamily N-acetyltransferase [Streptomyces sp. SPB162]